MRIEEQTPTADSSKLIQIREVQPLASMSVPRGHVENVRNRNLYFVQFEEGNLSPNNALFQVRIPLGDVENVVCKLTN